MQSTRLQLKRQQSYQLSNFAVKKKSWVLDETDAFSSLCITKQLSSGDLGSIPGGRKNGGFAVLLPYELQICTLHF